MIENKNGRLRSVRTPEEIETLLEEQINNLEPAERAVLELILKELRGEVAVPDGEKPLVEVLGEAEYRHKPVDMRTFLTDPYYLGESCKTLYPKLADHLVEIFEGDYEEIYLGGAIGIGKCVDGATEVYDPKVGRRRVAEIGPNWHVSSMNETNGKFRVSAASAFPSGTKRCVRLTLGAGQQLTLSNDHPVYTARGWVEASQLLPTDLVATPRTLPQPIEPLEISDAELLTVAYLAAEGGCTGPMTFTNAEPRILEEFTQLVGKVADTSQYSKYHRHIQPGVTAIFDPNVNKATTLRVRGIRELVRKHGMDCLAKEKRIPADFYRLPDRQIALFINRFWACDGHIHKDQNNLECTLASEGLVDDLRFLLLRLGIHSRKKYTPKSCEGKRFDAWRLTITSATEVLKFFDRIGPVFAKEKASAEIVQRVSALKTNTNVDIVPVDRDVLLRIKEELGSEKGRRLTKDYECPKGQHLSRDRFERLVKERKYEGSYAWLARSDLFWERVSELTDVGARDVYDLSVPGDHNFVANNIVIHNTFFVSIGISRILYEISCLKDPHSSYGIAAGSPIDVVCVSIKEILAQTVAFENIATKIKISPYFQEHFPFELTKKEIVFPNNIRVTPLATTTTSALGKNVHTAFIDEADFLPVRRGQTGEQEQQSDSIHASILSRMQSRFGRKGRLPGKLFVASSKTTAEGFTSKRLVEAANSPKIYSIDYSLWEAKPETYYKKTKFPVLCGTADITSKILTPEEYQTLKANPPEGVVLIEVPEDYRLPFELDIEKAIRDIAGIATVSVRPYIQRREKIKDAAFLGKTAGLYHPFSTEFYDMSKGGTFLWNNMVSMRQERAGLRMVESKLRPRLNPGADRHVHLDIGIKKDSLGFCMSHISGSKQVIRRTEDGREFYENAPIYTVDCMLRVVPPQGGEIILAEARHLVYDLIAHGYVITSVSFDSHQSVDSIQQMKARGLNAQLVSVDITPEPYDTLKMALYEDRVIMYEYPHIQKELSLLQEVYKGGRRKIDHPPKGCFVGSTRIPLLDGSQPQIQDLEGQEVWVYSATPDGFIVPGKARGRKTKSTRDLVDVTLHYGAVERCTPEHRWMLRDGSYVEAQDLQPGMELMPEHRVRLVHRVRMESPVEVFDLEVDQWSNFKLASGVVVHNSKDVSDALAGVIFTLSQQRTIPPLPIMRGAAYSPTPWTEGSVQSPNGQNPNSAQPLPPFLTSSGGGWGDPGDGWGNF